MFQRADTVYLSGVYSDQKDHDRSKLFDYLVNGNDGAVQTFSGEVAVVDGVADSNNFTVLHARSVAENVRYSLDGQPFNGSLNIVAGQLVNGSENVTVSGDSLLHSAALTTKAFTYSIFGEYGKYIVTMGLVLFAFSTAIAWSYYGDRAMIYLFGSKSVLPYRIVYCIGFFIAAFTDTRIVWSLSAVAIVLMALPNLFGIMMLRKEMKSDMTAYVRKYIPSKSE